MRLFLYVFRDYLKYVFGSITLCVFLFVMFDFIHKTTKYFDRYQPSTRNIVQFYFYQIPTLLNKSMPIASLIASVVCMILLSRTNEITAMRAAGMGPLRVGMPVAIGGALLSAISLFMGEAVIPKTSEKMHYVKDVKIEGESGSDGVIGSRWIRDQSRLINFREYDPINMSLSQVRIIQTGINFRAKENLEAESATYDPESNQWQLNKVKILYFRPNGTLAFTEQRDFQVQSLPIEPTKLKRDRRAADERSLPELYDLVSRGERSGADISGYKVDMHVKFAFHFAAFVVSLMGLQFGYRSERSADTARGVLFAMAVGISYYFIMQAGVTLAHNKYLPAFAGAWLANVTVFLIAALSIWNTRRA